MKKRYVKDELPIENEYVLIHLTKDNWGDNDDPEGKRYYRVAKFEKGISQKQREMLVKKKDSRGNTYDRADEHANNEVPYCWKEFGPSCFFGQEVDFWVRLD